MSLRNVLAAGLLFVTLGPVVSQPPPGSGGRPKREPRERPAELKVDWKEPPAGWVKNPRIYDRSPDPKIPMHYTMQGDVEWVNCTSTGEYTEYGFALYSGTDLNKDGTRSGSAGQSVTGFPTGAGKWYRFTFRGLAEPGFAVEKNGLFMHVDFFGNKGKNPLDGVKRDLYPLVERDRKELAENGVRRKNGGAVWKTYALDFRLPFAEIDSLNLSVGFKHGSATTDRNAEFYAAAFVLDAIPAPEDAPKVVKTDHGPAPSIASLIPLGGRWYYAPEPEMKARPATLVVTAKNAKRLYYQDGRLSNPFAENMTAWLRPGMLDLKGNAVTEDRFVPDNVVLEFKDGKELVVHTRNIPNHPTAKFPDRFGSRNPNSIQELDRAYYLPLEPVRNPKAVTMDKTNSNRALPGGVIGFAVNGVSFYNPFDMDGEDATDLMDRCCGHPSPDNRYHYHKYPVCVKTPFVDEGDGHSPLIGFALDGFAVYGPYVAKGVMAKDDTANPLDAFNMRTDADRGWHYHVTPGRYPYILGGFAGTPDARNLRRGPPR
ncbi:YHYH protein [Limnoglobus roseus]|uniref:YHYH protein n=1 Tax=Limnoglobus roseus TaxID=2598579 RepID=A0A5C1A468_9BACT|nr:YHYH protein [Limnoglobus roseus]QEL13891.1 YHYH protein [Limnoglobus roseus]